MSRKEIELKESIFIDLENKENFLYYFSNKEINAETMSYGISGDE
jgi:hypothetical protein